MSAVEREELDDPRVVFCGCGCGEPTNLRWLRVLDLREAGMPLKQVAEQVGVKHSYAKVLVSKARRGEWPRYLLGHVGKKMAQGPRKPCEFPGCANTVPGGWRVCIDARCRYARQKVRWGQASTPDEAWRSVEDGERSSLLRTDRWYYVPLPVQREYEALSDAIRETGNRAARAAYAERLSELLKDQRTANRDSVQAALSAMNGSSRRRRAERRANERDFFLAARELRRCERRREMWARQVELARDRAERQRQREQRRVEREMQQATRAAEREQRRVERGTDPDRSMLWHDGLVSLDTSLFDDGASSANRLPAHLPDVADQISTEPRSIADVQALIRNLPVIPGDWLRRLREGEIKLLIEDDEEPVFVTHHVIGDAVPWRDAPGPIPTTLALNGSINHGFGSSMKQKLKVARPGGHRTSRKPKVSR